jgi:hypothetical protein
LWLPYPLLFDFIFIISPLSFKYIVILLAVMAGHSWMNTPSSTHAAPIHDATKKETEDDDEEDKPRNFTAKQLLHFDGSKDEKSGEDKAVYLSVNGIVFDVSDGRNFYGPGKWILTTQVRVYCILSDSVWMAETTAHHHTYS